LSGTKVKEQISFLCGEGVTGSKIGRKYYTFGTLQLYFSLDAGIYEEIRYDLS
jgi:hypothetical protein